LHNGINYSEFSFNELSEKNLNSVLKEIREKLTNDIEKLKSSSVEFNTYPVIEEEQIKESFFGNVKILPQEVKKCSEFLVDFKVRYEEVHISKMFISKRP